MKRNLRLIMALLFVATTFSLQAQVAINTDGSNPDASAMLDVKSAAKGVLLSRVADVTAIASPATGLIAYQTSDNQFYYFDGTNWVRIIAEGPMGIVLNGMLDVHGSIKNTSTNNNGTVFIDDDNRVSGFFDVQGGVRNSSGSNDGAVLINDQQGLQISNMLDLRGVLKDSNDDNIEIAEDNSITMTGDDGDLILDDGADIILLDENSNLRINGEIKAPDDGEVDIDDDVMIDGELNVTDGIRNSDGWVAVTDGMGLRVNQMLNVRGTIKNLGPNNFGRVVIEDADGLTLDGGGLAATGGPVIIDDSEGLRVNEDLGVNGYARINGDIFSTSGDVDINDDVMITQSLNLNGGLFNSSGPVVISDGQGVRVDNMLDVRGTLKNNGGSNFGYLTIDDNLEVTGNLSVNGMIFDGDGAGSELMLSDGSGISLTAGGSNDLTLNAVGDDVVVNANRILLNGTEVMLVSDERFKDKIRPIDGAMSKIASLSGYTYFWNGLREGLTSENKQYGVIAQEVEAMFPNLVMTDEEGYKAVNYTGLIPVLIQATNEQNEKVEAQQKEIDELKAELQTLKAMMLKQMESNK